MNRGLQMSTTTEIVKLINATSARSDVPDEVRDKLQEIAEQMRSTGASDVWMYRSVVLILGVVALASIVGGVSITLVLRDTTHELPQAVVAMGSAAVGALAGLLAPTARR